MIATVSTFTLLILQMVQFFSTILILYFMVWLISKPVKFFWRSITFKTKYYD